MSDMGPGEYFICGGFGGICTVLVGHPLDTIKVKAVYLLVKAADTERCLLKSTDIANLSVNETFELLNHYQGVRLQTMPVPKAGESPLYSGTLDCFKKTITHEGVRGLYKGMGAPLLGVSPIFAISFMGYGVGKQIFGSSKGNQLSYLEYFCAGAFSGIFTTVIMAPGERIKCLLQVQQGANAPKLYNGPLDCAKKLYRQGGIASIYRGSGATLLRDIPASGMYFLTYEAIKDYITDNGTHPPSILGTILAGGSAGIANWAVGMPPDVLKSRLQTAPEGTYPNGIRDVFKHLMKNEGPLALYKGITPVLLRAFPANAACFVGFELCKQFIDFLFPKQTKTEESIAA